MNNPHSCNNNISLLSKLKCFGVCLSITCVMISSSLHKAHKQLLAALLEVITSPCFPHHQGYARENPKVLTGLYDGVF